MSASVSRRYAPAHNVKVGDWFYCSWGYDQTNVDFYRVVGVTPKSVKIQQWTTTYLDTEVGAGYSDKVVPNADGGPLMESDWSAVDRDADYWTRQEQIVKRPSPILTKRVQDSGHGRVGLSMNSYSAAFPWSGAPKYATAMGYGH